jgi:DNA-binding beta-propeller fold protein YncE
MGYKSWAILLLTVAAAGKAAASGEEMHRYKVLAEYSSLGGTGTKYCAIADKRLYVPNDDKLLVLDAVNGTPVGTVPAREGHIHGVALVVSLSKGFIAVETGWVLMFDLKSLEIMKRIRIPFDDDDDPFMITYDSASQRVFALGRHTTVVDPQTGDKTADFTMSGDPDSVVSNSDGVLYVALSEKGVITTIDSRNSKVLSESAVAQCAHPSSLSYDDSNKRLFAGCGDEQLVAINPKNMQVTARVQVGSQLSNSAFYPKEREVFAFSDGKITQIKQISADQYKSVDVIDTQWKYSNMLLDPGTGRIYLNGGGRDYAQKGLGVLVLGEHSKVD